jgi:hypothetical protein
MAAFALFLADAAEEGKDVVLSMLVVGLVIVAVVVIGDLYAWRASKRHNAQG